MRIPSDQFSTIVDSGVKPKGEPGAHAIALTALNKVVQLLINAGTGILTARLLMPTGRGELAAMILWPPFLTSVTTLGIPSAIIYTLRKSKRPEAGEIATGFLMTLILAFVAALAGAIWIPHWLGGHYDASVIHAAQCFLVLTPVIALTQLGRAIFESRALFSRSNRMLLLIPATTLVVLLVLISLHRLTPFSAGIAYMAGYVPPFILMLTWISPTVRPPWHLSLSAGRALMSYGIRSFGVDILGTLALQVDQVLVISLLSSASMGRYGVLLNLSRMFNIFQASVVMVLFPKAAGQSTEAILGMTERSARISTMITGICCFAASLSGLTILRLLYGEAYADNAITLRLLLLEVTLSGAVFILAQAFMALGRPGVVTILQGLGLAISIPLMLWLVPRFGTEGAALSLLTSTLARLLFVYLGFPLIIKVRPPKLMPTRHDLAMMVSALRRIVASTSH